MICLLPALLFSMLCAGASAHSGNPPAHGEWRNQAVRKAPDKPGRERSRYRELIREYVELAAKIKALPGDSPSRQPLVERAREIAREARQLERKKREISGRRQLRP